MEKLKEFLKKEKMVWVEVTRKSAKEFLIFAKTNNFRWISGKNIKPNTDKPFLHLSLDNNGFLANVPAIAWISKQFKNIKKYSFEEFKKIYL